MLKSCKYCGQVHDSKHDCGRRPVKHKCVTDKDKFRWTTAWQGKRKEIKERDKYLCQVCIRQRPPVLMSGGLQVHHSIPLEDAWDKRMDNDNLITLCEAHHKMAEKGEISYKEIQGVIAEQEAKDSVLQIKKQDIVALTSPQGKK